MERTKNLSFILFMEFVFPGIEAAGAGKMAYPTINEAQAKALIQVAHKAPFGKGSETIVDNKSEADEK